jgi:hypothetical protein
MLIDSSVSSVTAACEGVNTVARTVLLAPLSKLWLKLQQICAGLGLVVVSTCVGMPYVQPCFSAADVPKGGGAVVPMGLLGFGGRCRNGFARQQCDLTE